MRQDHERHGLALLLSASPTASTGRLLPRLLHPANRIARPGIIVLFQLEGITARAPSMRTSHLLPVQSSTHKTI